MGSPTPFTRLSRQVLADNPWHRYCLDRYVRPDGSEGEYFYLDIPGSAAVVPLFEDGSTALLEVHRYLLGRKLLEFPIGGMHAGEDPLEAAQRELAEEAGLHARDWHCLGRVAPYKGASNEIGHYFLARGLVWTEQRLEPSEAIMVHRMPLSEARRRLLEQPVGDGQSWVALQLLDRWLQE